VAQIAQLQDEIKELKTKAAKAALLEDQLKEK